MVQRSLRLERIENSRRQRQRRDPYTRILAENSPVRDLLNRRVPRGVDLPPDEVAADGPTYAIENRHMVNYTQRV